MKRKYLGLSVLTAGITGLFLAGGVAWGQIGSEYDPLWKNLGCGPYNCFEEISVPDEARDCEESWRKEAVPVAVVSVEDQTYAEVETTVQSPAEEQAGEQPVAESQASEDSDYWYDSETNQYHRYRFAEHAADTPNESAGTDKSYQADMYGYKGEDQQNRDLSPRQEYTEPLYDEAYRRDEAGGDRGENADSVQIQVVEGEGCPTEGTEPGYSELGAEPARAEAAQDEFEKMFEIENVLTEGQPTVDEHLWAEAPASPSPDVLLRVARALDHAGSALQSLSRHLTEMAERELAKASGGNMHR
ncbi:MAG: hypothetical protein NTY19_01555 [Planctomycetota bacterium]|nr:hypothetical protein [Planctomycetota bacterium]